MTRRVRKQVEEIRADDFEAHPCWEYASDEEDRKGQNECTVRPLDLARLQSETGQVIVQAVFFFPNGRIRLGAVTLNAGSDPSAHQPMMFVGKKVVHFYNGSFEPKKTEVKAFLRQLEEVCPKPFPIRYVSSLQTPEGRPLAFGELNGLYWLANWRTNELRTAA